MKSKIIKKITLGWKDLISTEILAEKPDGYDTVDEIAEKVGVTPQTIRTKMKRLRDAGGVGAVRIYSGTTPAWVYKR